MNRPLLVLLTAAAISVTAVSAASAGPRHRHHDRNWSAYVPNDRYCLQGRIWGYPGNCQFATYEQCVVTASGTDAYCGINPQYYAVARQGYYR
ncbi:DUF3551 domain-containing protein [Bradyrhizobium sp. CCBAU 51753]|uniref:DUF3551 domain-containing protein n=1 Tax=Bradyrhizobium sp. CCBAU 51753 TaxID=1325100 RepID=UPI00188C7AB6|nr:DUF3551 domain-containing protein [Bradyrhizobium sp. CCBAU 51753]QOZ25252.1 hypothetical protein XH93_17905 [Bradyrhizobium sp. CCBAU 51753]